MIAMVKLCLTLLAWGGCASAAFAQVVAPTHTLRPGDLVSANDVQILETSLHGAFSDTSQVLGKEVQRVLYRGRPLQPGDIGAPALVERNEVVTLIYRTGTLSIVTEGRALGRGAAGDKLRVLNLTSRNTVIGRVTKAGQVIAK